MHGSVIVGRSLFLPAPTFTTSNFINGWTRKSSPKKSALKITCHGNAVEIRQHMLAIRFSPFSHVAIHGRANRDR
jgi:hypothetical protein